MSIKKSNCYTVALFKMLPECPFGHFCLLSLELDLDVLKSFYRYVIVSLDFPIHTENGFKILQSVFIQVMQNSGRNTKKYFWIIWMDFGAGKSLYEQRNSKRKNACHSNLIQVSSAIIQFRFQH